MSSPTNHTSPPAEWAPADLEAVACCPACGGTEFETLYRDLPDQVFAIAGGTWTIMSCHLCGAAFLSPRPARHALDRAYAGDYYTHEPIPQDATAGLAPLSGHRLRSRNAYLNRRFGVSLTPASANGLRLANVSPRFRASQARLVRHLARPNEGSTLLDVGCGSGGFVALAQTLGWSARGIDIDRAAVEAGRAMGFPLSCASIDDEAKSSPAAFDVVTMEHVLEHVPDPLAFLRAAHALLRPGGDLWIATPNVNSSAHRRFGRSWIHLDPPRHLVVLTGDILDNLLRAAGFASITPRASASGTIATYAQSALIEQGLSPLEQAEIPFLTALWGRVAGLRALRRPRSAEELIRVARIDR